jgi:hypothetical protein
MTPRLFEDIRINATRIVSRGVSEYERVYGRFKIDALKQKFLDTSLELFLRIIERVFEDEEVSLLPFKEVLLESLFDLGFDAQAVINIYAEINKELITFIKKEPNYDANLARIFNTYLLLIQENIGDYGFYASSSVADILRSQPQYQYSDQLNTFVPKEIFNNTIYTLFPKERTWEVFSVINRDEAYSPLSYNRVASGAGFSKYRINVSYEDLIIYQGELYKLRPDVSEPALDGFDAEQWTPYSSKILDKSKTFKSIYSEKIRQVFGEFADKGFEVNEIISDSYITRYSEPPNIDPDLLPSTFAGVGKQILETTEQLEQITDGFGSYEGSVVGGVEYIAQFSEYLFAAAFGKNTPAAFDITDGATTFGKFNILYASKTSENKIPGLKFLEGFGRLKTFAHGQTIAPRVNEVTEKIVYNPIYVQFVFGVEDTFRGLTTESGYSEPPRVDLLLYAIESLYRRAGSVGDLIKAGINSLDKKGRISEYEGLGSIEIQLKRLQRVFPPSTFFLDLPEGTKIGPGLTGVLRYLLNNYSRFSQGSVNPILPGRSLEFLGPWIEGITNKLEELLGVLRGIGVGTSAYIPNLSFKAFEYENTQLIGFLRGLGFRDSEINQLLDVKNFTELIQKFAPLTDSADLKSFFRAYELTQLIYEFGGQDGINAYISFLYSTNELDSLLNILSLAQKDKSKFTHIQLNKYPKLIGLLIGLTYAVDPQQLIKFNKILGANNLTLLESISFLYQQGESTIIKSAQDVQLLEPLVEQMIAGGYGGDAFAAPALNYQQTNSVVPIALKQWTKIIGDNLGRVETKDLIHDLYDRSVGLTPKELISILNYPNSPNQFGSLVDGFAGGSFTSFLKYANITGLGLKLGFYKNSYQTNNFEITGSGEFAIIPNFIEAIDKLIESIAIIKTVFNATLDYTFVRNQELSNSLGGIISAQNKTYETLVDLVEKATLGESLGQQQALAAEAPIAESPGIGNSRLPNRVPALNSITPEQFKALSNQTLSTFTAGFEQNFPSGLINNFIKFTEENQFANEINVIDEIRGKINADSRKKLFTPATSYELVEGEALSHGSSREYVLPTIYLQLSGDKRVVSSGLGTNYISSDKGNGAPFSPVESCRRFGGSNCEELYADVPDRCVTGYNKSLAPETYAEVPGVSPTAVVVDRPLGSFAEYKPQEPFVPNKSFATPPAYYALLPDNTVPGEKAEPILNTIFSEPLVFEKGTGELSEYGNSEFAIVEFIRAKLEKTSEFGCAGFESPYLYQVCMNIMKCKRFSPPLESKYSLDFCPKTLSGGRLK